MINLSLIIIQDVNIMCIKTPSLTVRFSVTVLLLLSFAHGICKGQNINQNSVIINNQPVIEKKEYIIKYRPVYIDKPQPQRSARKLSAPVCLLNYLWIYPEDLGSYTNGPNNIIAQINRQGMYGRNSWRVPTDEELRLMENYADICGLGDDIYLSISHRNGILRLVSSGMSIQEQQAVEREQQAQQEALRRQREQEQAAAAADAAAQANAAHRAQINRQKNLVSSGSAVFVGNLLWATSNKGAKNQYDKGIAYSDISLNDNWRLPTADEFRALIKQSTKHDSYFMHSSGLVIPFGVYAVEEGYIMLPIMMVSSGAAAKFVRTVQNKIY